MERGSGIQLDRNPLHTGTGPEPTGGEHAEPESPVFDESFALDAQLILGSLVTPATVAKPPAQRQAAPSEAVQQVSTFLPHDL